MQNWLYHLVELIKNLLVFELVSHRLKLVRGHYISKLSFNMFLSSLGFQIKLEQVIIKLVQLVMFETFKQVFHFQLFGFLNYG